MVQLPFSATAALILIGAMAAGGAVGIVTWSPAPEQPVQASAAPSVPAVTPVANETAPELQSQPGNVERTAAIQQPTPADGPAPLPPQISVEHSETTIQSTTTTIVAAPVIVTSWGVVSGCVGCVVRQNPPHPPVAATNHANHRTEPREAPVVRHEAPPPHFVHSERIATAAAHSR